MGCGGLLIPVAYTGEQIAVVRNLESKSKFYKPSTMVYGLSTTKPYL